jgi:hypothetical protein
MSRALVAAVLCVVATAGPAAQKGRDLSKLDACKILPAADVAAAVKRKIATALGAQLHCMYTPAAPEAIADAYDFYIAEAAIVEAMLKIPGKRTPVPGLWTEAYIEPAGGDTPNLLSIVALKKGDIAFEIKGLGKDSLIALARVAASRLQ